jgi:hypothetical protein
MCLVRESKGSWMNQDLNFKEMLHYSYFIISINLLFFSLGQIWPKRTYKLGIWIKSIWKFINSNGNDRVQKLV